jgi:hypothetical protein
MSNRSTRKLSLDCNAIARDKTAFPFKVQVDGYADSDLQRLNSQRPLSRYLPTPFRCGADLVITSNPPSIVKAVLPAIKESLKHVSVAFLYHFVQYTAYAI